MMFYNGFNLMIDMIIVGLALVACRHYWLKGYGAGQYDLLDEMEMKGEAWIGMERDYENN